MYLYLYAGKDGYKKISINTKCIKRAGECGKSIIKHFNKVKFETMLKQKIFESAATVTPRAHNCAADAIKHANINTITDTMASSFYNVKCIGMHNLATVNYSDCRRWWNLTNTENIDFLKTSIYLAGLNVVSAGLVSRKTYSCNVCGVIITGQLNKYPVFDHLVHSPNCAYIKLSNDVECAYTITGYPIVYETIAGAACTPTCVYCNVNPVGVLYMDCAHADACKTCFMAKKTCMSCDVETTEFCVLNYSTTQLNAPVYMKTNVINISDMSSLYESQVFYVNIPCMHVTQSVEKGFCESCMTSLIGHVDFTYTYRH